MSIVGSVCWRGSQAAACRVQSRRILEQSLKEWNLMQLGWAALRDPVLGMRSRVLSDIYLLLLFNFLVLLS